MKTNFYLIIFLLFNLNIKTFATIWRVNNKPGITANFTTAQAAHNGASNGDTIYLEGSTATYGSLVCSKYLIWIGSGYFLTSSLQFNTSSSKLSSVSSNPGSANSIFQGLEVISSHFYISDSNITVKRCKIGGNIYFNLSGTNPICSNFKLSQSMLLGGVAQINVNGAISSNLIINNNVILGGITLSANYQSVYITNNFLNSIVGIDLCIIQNNIIWNGTIGNPAISANPFNVSHNLFMQNSNSNYVGSNGNIFDSGSPSFTNSVFNGTYSSSNDTWIILKNGSPAIGIGIGGIDLGPLGGVASYKFSGIPAVPTIFSLQVNSTPGSIIPVMISTRGNN